jgi:hypothetical protein
MARLLVFVSLTMIIALLASMLVVHLLWRRSLPEMPRCVGVYGTTAAAAVLLTEFLLRKFVFLDDLPAIYATQPLLYAGLLVPAIEETFRFSISYAVARKHSLDLVSTLSGVTQSMAIIAAVARSGIKIVEFDAAEAFVTFWFFVIVILVQYDMFLIGRLAIGRMNGVFVYLVALAAHISFNVAFSLFDLMDLPGASKNAVEICGALVVLVSAMVALEWAYRRPREAVSV